MDRRWVLLAVSVLSLALVSMLGGCTTVQATGTSSPDSVTVKGTGDALAVPDLAEMTFTAFSVAPDAKAAMGAAGKTAEAIVGALRKAGVPEEDLQTTGVTLRPEYAYAEGSAPRITGYRADIAVKATVRKIDILADVIAAGTGAGALEMVGPAFRLADDNEKRFEAIEEAVTDAKARAAAMAKAGGRSLGEVVRMGEADVRAEVPVPWGDRAMLSAGVPEGAIQPGQLETTAEVVVEFRLK